MEAPKRWTGRLHIDEIRPIIVKSWNRRRCRLKRPFKIAYSDSINILVAVVKPQLEAPKRSRRSQLCWHIPHRCGNHDRSTRHHRFFGQPVFDITSSQSGNV